MTNPVKAFEAALRKAEADPVKALAAKRVRQSPPGSKTAGKYDKQDAHKALTIALRELNNAASTIYYRVRGEGSERNPRVPGTGMAFSPEDMRTLLKAEKQIREAQELASSASRAIDDIDLGMHDRYDSYDDPL